jgi:hypothetical protein
MKCTIESVRFIELGEETRCSIKGFIPMESTRIIPRKICKWLEQYKGVKATLYDDGIMITVISSTRCCGDDEFSLRKGYYISESKCKRRIYTFIKNFSERMANHFNNVSCYFEDSYLKYDHCSIREIRRIREIGNRVKE